MLGCKDKIDKRELELCSLATKGTQEQTNIFLLVTTIQLRAQRCQAPSRPVGLRALRALAYDHNTPPPLA